jgi:hypothetical protein
MKFILLSERDIRGLIAVSCCPALIHPYLISNPVNESRTLDFEVYGGMAVEFAFPALASFRDPSPWQEPSRYHRSRGLMCQEALFRLGSNSLRPLWYLDFPLCSNVSKPPVFEHRGSTCSLHCHVTAIFPAYVHSYSTT